MTRFTIERRFDASPEDLWDAWTNPDEVVHWWHPRGAHVDRETVFIDARVGGRFSYTMVNDQTGDRYPMLGTYRQIERPERLEFTWGPADAPRKTSALVEVDITPDGAGSRMVFTMTRQDSRHDDAYAGWNDAFEILAAHLAHR